MHAKNKKCSTYFNYFKQNMFKCELLTNKLSIKRVVALAHNSIQLSTSLKNSIIDFSRHIVGKCSLLAIGIIQHSTKMVESKPLLEVLVVVHDFQPKMMSYLKSFDETIVMIVAIDQWVFERDIEQGILGESIASTLIFPHDALYGDAYLRGKEIVLKKRLILEVLENLVQSFPELAYKFQIKPQYFMYEIILNRVKVFPLIAKSVSDLMGNGKLQNEAEALQNYITALNQLKAEKIINFSDENITITRKFVASCQDPKIKIVNTSKNVPRKFFTSLFGVLPQIINSAQNAQSVDFSKLQRSLEDNQAKYFLNPQKFVFFPTSTGLVSLADSVDIAGFARKFLVKDSSCNIKVSPIGGMLNSVYLMKISGKEGDRKVIVKCFKDWSGFKWYPLSLWSFGARSFALSNQARLAKECAANEFLRSAGFNVPKVFCVSNANSLIFMEFIEGENLGQAIKRIVLAGSHDKMDELSKIEQAGVTLAKVHALNMTLGDTKPENMMLSPDGKFYLIDFEQATQNGDKSWDIAVFLYFAGTYFQPFSSNGIAKAIVQAFLSGYLKGGGNLKDLKKVADGKYTRVFSVFTMPAIIKVIVDTCKNADNLLIK